MPLTVQLFKSISMGAQLTNIQGYYEYKERTSVSEVRNQVFLLAQKVMDPLIESGLPEDLSHILIATTCPDLLSPSLGQMIKEHYIKELSHCLSLDIVQGCAGGVSTMILASQLSESYHSSVLVVNADAARKATSKKSSLHRIFGNGSFACLIRNNGSKYKLIHSKSIQYKGLHDVVQVHLGHDSDEKIRKAKQEIFNDPRKYLGLSLNKGQALRLFGKAEKFYREFVEESQPPEIMILHQVNPLIMKHLEITFQKYGVKFIDMSGKIGNCGAASVGIALDLIKEDIKGKRLMLCSFGTGGVITAGLWQC